MFGILRLWLLAALEATIYSLPLALINERLPWWSIWLAMMLGWAADWFGSGQRPAWRQQALRLVGAGLAVWLVLSHSLALAPLAALAALQPGHPMFISAYLATLIGLFLAWRGTRLQAADRQTVVSIFGRGATFFLVMLLLLPLLGGDTATTGTTITAHLLSLIGLGLLTMAVSHALEQQRSQRERLGWPWLISLLLATIVIVFGGGAVIGAITGDESLTMIQQGLGLILLPFAFIGGVILWIVLTLVGEPLAWILAGIIEAFRNLRPPAFTEQIETALGTTEPAAEWTSLDGVISAAGNLLALIPLAILVVALLFIGRQRQAMVPRDEQRESLGLLNGLSGDLRELLANLAKRLQRPIDPLQAALAALDQANPEQRIRRAYVRTLIAMQRSDHPRSTAQTPAEYQTVLATTSGEAAASQHLTACYEQARYAEVANPSLAEQAEQAEQVLRQQIK